MPRADFAHRLRLALVETAGFTVTAGSHVVTLMGLNPQGGDNTACLDEVFIDPFA